MLLYYPLEKVIPEFTNTFNVYIRAEGGTAEIGTGGCVASISGQSMAAKDAWDGEITAEDRVGRFGIGGRIVFRGFSESVGSETKESWEQEYQEAVGRIRIGAFAEPFESV